LKTATYLLDQKCCDESSCSQLVDDLQDLQFKCNDIFGNAGVNSLEKDEKGNIEGTVCSLLRDKKVKFYTFSHSKRPFCVFQREMV